jgi:hypothetical protein
VPTGCFAESSAANKVYIAAVPGALEALVNVVTCGSPMSKGGAAGALKHLAYNGA